MNGCLTEIQEILTLGLFDLESLQTITEPLLDSLHIFRRRGKRREPISQFPNLPTPSIHTAQMNIERVDHISNFPGYRFIDLIVNPRIQFNPPVLLEDNLGTVQSLFLFFLY